MERFSSTTRISSRPSAKSCVRRGSRGQGIPTLKTRMPMAAPMATTSSGFTPLCGSLPASSPAISCTLGIRVIPPTSTRLPTSPILRPESSKQDLKGFLVRSYKSSQICSSFERVSWMLRCFGPLASAVMNGRLMSVL